MNTHDITHRIHNGRCLTCITPYSTGANPPAHQGSKWQTEPQENNCGEKYCSRIHPTDEPPKRNLEQQLCDVLMNHTGEHGQNEGAVECLERIIRERDLLLKRAMEDMLKPAHY
jgi:hypothetical protein